VVPVGVNAGCPIIGSGERDSAGLACGRVSSPRGRDPAELRLGARGQGAGRGGCRGGGRGFDSAWVTDHLVVPAEYANVYGTIAEALVSLGFLAARTTRLELGVSALVVPQRNPLVALKQLTTLDFLSGGRIVTAVAAGWMEPEFTTLAADFEGRGRLLDEWLELADSVFQQMPGHIRYEGRTFSFDGWMAPALVRPGGPELWVAGVSRATLRRAALTGVWHPVALPPTSLSAWLLTSEAGARTAVSSSASASTSSGNQARTTTSAADTHSPGHPSGSRQGFASTSMRAQTGSS
jgi:alkanesulfonate monooxygenase SsuD/methylene tetrahydromethanopterin reductase-like flavin-dependent oxidoreductase (luciferase family)